MAVTAAFSFVVSCSGGDDGLDVDTVSAPATLDDLILTVPGTGVSFEFARNSSSSVNVFTGGPETGNVLLSTQGREIDFDNQIGVQTTVFWPDTVEQASYTYTANNNSSGTLDITTSNAEYSGVNTLDLTDFLNGDIPWLGFFHSNVDGNRASVTTRFILTFDTDGASVTEVGMTIFPLTISDMAEFSILHPQSNFVGVFVRDWGIFPWTEFGLGATVADATFALNGASLTTNGGTSVPIEYEQPNLTGDIVPDSLDLETIQFTPAGSASPTFSVIFDAQDSEGNEETGVGTYVDLSPPTPVNEDITFTFTHQDGIDVGQLTLGQTVSPTLTMPGTYTLTFDSIGETSLSNQVLAGTYTVAETSAVGTFRMATNRP